MWKWGQDIVAAENGSIVVVLRSSTCPWCPRSWWTRSGGRSCWCCTRTGCHTSFFKNRKKFCWFWLGSSSSFSPCWRSSGRISSSGLWRRAYTGHRLGARRLIIVWVDVSCGGVRLVLECLVMLSPTQHTSLGDIREVDLMLPAQDGTRVGEISNSK